MAATGLHQHRARPADGRPVVRHPAQPPGVWVKPISPHRNQTFWHWRHKDEPTFYCGVRLPQEVDATERAWNPISHCCRKCLTRILREGY